MDRSARPCKGSRTDLGDRQGRTVDADLERVAQLRESPTAKQPASQHAAGERVTGPCRVLDPFGVGRHVHWANAGMSCHAPGPVFDDEALQLPLLAECFRVAATKRRELLLVAEVPIA